MTTLLILATVSTLYQNDFTTRTSAPGEGPGSAWSKYEYVTDQPAADNYEGHGVYFKTIAYNWKPCQDGWVKVPSVAEKNDYMGCHIAAIEGDPCMVFSGSNFTFRGELTLAKDHSAYFSQPIRNVFKTGEVKFQFDLRQPKVVEHSGIVCWFMPTLEWSMNQMKGDGTKHALQLGLNASNFSGGWRKDPEAADGTRDFVTYGSGKAQDGHWYRHYVTLHLDSNSVDFDVYDLGTSRLGMDVKPGGDPAASVRGANFRYRIGDTYGGISGITVVIQQLDTHGIFGMEGFDADLAYMMDNVKGAYKAPGTSDFVEFYRNDFTTSKRRTVDGSVKDAHDFVYGEPEALTETFYLPDTLVHPFTDHSGGKPYLCAVYDAATRKNLVQLPGADGWRFIGHYDFRSSPFVTKIGDNYVMSVASYGQAMQPMCPEVKSGKVRFEFDQRMPKGWNGTQRCEIDLFSDEAYEKCAAYGDYASVRCGCAGAAAGTETEPNTAMRTFFCNNGSGTYYDFKQEGLTWYRFRVDFDFSTKGATFKVWEIGDDAPANPDDFVPSDATYKDGRTPSVKFPKGDNAISTWGFANWQRSLAPEGEDVADYQMFIDNVRFWKLNDDGSLGDLLFCNTFDKTERHYTAARKALWDEPNNLIDRPEYCEDGIIIAPTYYSPAYVTGKDHSLQLSPSTFHAMVIPLGRTIKSGVMEAQYDVKLPSMAQEVNTLRVSFGAGQLASASILPSQYKQRFNMGYSFDTGIVNDGQTEANGVMSVMRGTCWEGTTGGKGGNDSKWYFTIGTYPNKWIRVKIVAYMDLHKYSIQYFDMGYEHPTFDTPDGTCLKDWSASRIPFRWNEPISHLYLTGGKTPSYAPWKDDAPGAMLVDNIKVCHDKQGLYLSIR